MSRHRTLEPNGALVLTDGGLETDLIYHQGFELEHFAACELLRSERGIRALTEYYEEFARIAVEAGIAFSLDTATWRANPDWTDRLGYSREEFEQVNRTAVDLAVEVRRRYQSRVTPIVIAGVIGPRGDGYVVDEMMSAEDALEYHSAQIAIFAGTEVDFISALTLTYSAEAIGIARAAQAAGFPVVLSFTVETDGTLPSGESLREAVEAVDESTGGYADSFMVNCAHPTHLPEDLFAEEAWTQRVRGYRANASTLSHAELDAASELDAGDPDALAIQLRELRERMPQLAVLGGCCGTDARHLRALARELA
jgi:S-methylmethionine-dependent homocysteine/selenocysteine methylase